MEERAETSGRGAVRATPATAPGRTIGQEAPRGADLWHLACALYAAESPADLSFLTLDARQRALAEVLGFPG